MRCTSEERRGQVDDGTGSSKGQQDARVKSCRLSLDLEQASEWMFLSALVPIDKMESV